MLMRISMTGVISQYGAPSASDQGAVLHDEIADPSSMLLEENPDLILSSKEDYVLDRLGHTQLKISRCSMSGRDDGNLERDTARSDSYVIPFEASCIQDMPLQPVPRMHQNDSVAVYDRAHARQCSRRDGMGEIRVGS